MIGFVETYKTQKPFKSIQIGDPKIVEVNATSDRTLTLLPLSNGFTNILFMNDMGETIDSIVVWVNEAGANRVQVIRRPLTSATSYRCGATGCVLVGTPPPAAETPPTAPPPTPTVTRTERQDFDANGVPTGGSRSRQITQ
jgi:hypothetical protein